MQPQLISDLSASWNGVAWPDLHGGIGTLSNFIILAACSAMTALLIRLVLTRPDLPFKKVIWLFGTLCVLTGAAHLIDPAILEWPAYWQGALIGLLTAAILITMVYGLYQIFPQLITSRSVSGPAHEILESLNTENKLVENQFLLSEAARACFLGGWQIDLATKKISFSNTLRDVYNLTDDYKIDHTAFFDFFIEADRQILKDAFADALLNGIGWDLELQIITSQGERKWVRHCAEHLTNSDGELTKIRGFVVDIDRYKGREIALRQSLLEIERSNQNLEQFALIASHDLKEPLRKINVFGNLLAERYREQLGEGISLVEKMYSTSQRMASLVDDLLTFSSIGTSKGKTSHVDLNEIANAVLVELELTVQETQALIVVDNLPTITGDASQLRQLFQNLISNSLKFRRAGIPPLVHIKYISVADSAVEQQLKVTNTDARYHRIDFSDNGIGFDQKDAVRIFQAFERLHGNSTFPGTGIGLAICQKVAANHGGEIIAHAAKGQGATFSVSLLRHGIPSESRNSY